MHAPVELLKYKKASEKGFLNTAFSILKDQQNEKKKKILLKYDHLKKYVHPQTGSKCDTFWLQSYLLYGNCNRKQRRIKKCPSCSQTRRCDSARGGPETDPIILLAARVLLQVQVYVLVVTMRKAILHK